MTRTKKVPKKCIEITPSRKQYGIRCNPLGIKHMNSQSGGLRFKAEPELSGLDEQNGAPNLDYSQGRLLV